MKALCKYCQRPLEDAQVYGGYKSCPQCSQNAGEHIFYAGSNFGWTEKRVTSKNVDGIQSWCARCRAHKKGPYSDGIKCSELAKKKIL